LCIFYIVICAVAISRFSIQCRLHLRWGRWRYYKSISGYNDERVVVRVDDTFVKFCNLKCLLSPSEYLNGDVSTIYVKF
jgi:hypothetical protein